MWASGVRCPVGRPGLWASGVRYPGVPRLLCPNRVSSSSAPMRRAATRRRRPEVGVVTPHGIHDRLVVCPSRSLTLEAGAGRAGPTEASAWPWSSGGPRPAAGLDRLADQEEPVAQGPLVGREPGMRRGSPPAAWLCAGRQGHDRRHEADHDLGAGWALGATARRACGPDAAQAGQWVRPAWGRQRSELGEQWWACQDLNLGPHPYQGCALTA